MKKSGQNMIHVTLNRKELEDIIIGFIRESLGPARLIGFNIEDIDILQNPARDDSDAVHVVLIKDVDL